MFTFANQARPIRKIFELELKQPLLEASLHASACQIPHRSAITLERFSFIQDSISRNALVNVLPTGCITLGMSGETLAPIGSLKNAGAIAITDDGKCVQDNQLMRKALEYCHMFDLCVMDHCQDESLTQGAVMNEGEVSLWLGLTGWPSSRRPNCRP